MSSTRSRQMVVPREHGAWGLLLIPFCTGAATGIWSGGNFLPLVPLAIAVVGLFWLRTPVESWLGTSPLRAQPGAELRRVRLTVARLGAISVAALVWLFWGGRNRDLWWVGAGAAAAFLTQALLKTRWRKARIVAQMIGAAGLTATAPAAYYAAIERWTAIATMLWLANLMFAINQVHFVQLRIHAAKVTERAEKLAAGRGFLIGQVLLLLAIGSACRLGVFPWYGALAFVPLLYRGFAWFGQKSGPLAVRALGWSELRIAIVFGVLLVVGVSSFG